MSDFLEAFDEETKPYRNDSSSVLLDKKNSLLKIINSFEGNEIDIIDKFFSRIKKDERRGKISRRLFGLKEKIRILIKYFWPTISPIILLYFLEMPFLAQFLVVVFFMAIQCYFFIIILGKILFFAIAYKVFLLDKYFEEAVEREGVVEKGYTMGINQKGE